MNKNGLTSKDYDLLASIWKDLSENAIKILREALVDYFSGIVEDDSEFLNEIDKVDKSGTQIFN